ncbi:unnamed protein product [Urochloa humidicola]
MPICTIARIFGTATINEASDAFPMLKMLIGDATKYRRHAARGIEKRELLWRRLPNESASFWKLNFGARQLIRTD